MWLTNLFKFSYILPQPCLGCSARQNHIEDLQELLKSERASFNILQDILIGRAGLMPQVQSSEAEPEMKPLRTIQTVAQLRKARVSRENAEHPDANKEYWNQVRQSYEQAGKLPETKDGG